MAVELAYGVRLHDRLWVADARHGGDKRYGWRKFRWVRGETDAMKFSSAEKAAAFARLTLPHDEWTVGVILPRGVGPDNLGGTPMAIAA